MSSDAASVGIGPGSRSLDRRHEWAIGRIIDAFNFGDDSSTLGLCDKSFLQKDSFDAFAALCGGKTNCVWVFSRTDSPKKPLKADARKAQSSGGSSMRLFEVTMTPPEITPGMQLMYILRIVKPDEALERRRPMNKEAAVAAAVAGAQSLSLGDADLVAGNVEGGLIIEDVRELMGGVYMPLLRGYSQKEQWVMKEEGRGAAKLSAAAVASLDEKMEAEKFLEAFGELLSYVEDTVHSLEDRVELVEIPFTAVETQQPQQPQQQPQQQSQQDTSAATIVRSPSEFTLQQSLMRLDNSATVSGDAMRTTMKDMTLMWAGSLTSSFVENCERNVASWAEQIERALVVKEVDVMAVLEAGSIGPASELLYWKVRMARLCSITDQLAQPNIKRILTTVQNSGERQLRQRWREVERLITEAANEAKDNTKYLSTFDQLAKPLYRSDPVRIVDSLHPLINAVKTLQSIAKFYSTPERMLSLFAKITNQMVIRCKEYVLEGGDFWDQDRHRLIEKLKHCIDLNDAYIDQFHITQAALRDNHGGHQFDFNEDIIFGKFKAFCNRLLKLMDVLRSAHQFTLLSETEAQMEMPGLRELTDTFQRVFKTIQRRKNTSEGSRERNLELLDPKRGDFEGDYLAFMRTVLQLETRVQELINKSFEDVTRTTTAVRVLEQFKAAFRRGNLDVDLDSKYIFILNVYKKDLEIVRKMYENDKADPPKPRNDPPAAGAISWARQLHRRIEGPMKLFSVHPYILGLPEAKPTILLYNKVAKALVKYEDLWHASWREAIDAARVGLHATILVRHPKTKRLYVNFDRQILQVIREAVCMARLGLPVPADLVALSVQEKDLKNRAELLSFVIDRYISTIDSLPDHWVPLLRPRLSSLRHAFEPGYTNLTWSSINTDAYIAELSVAVDNLVSIVARARAIEDYRIQPDLKFAAGVRLMSVPDVVLAADEYIALIRSICTTAAVDLETKNQAIEGAVNDLVACLTDEVGLGEDPEAASPNTNTHRPSSSLRERDDALAAACVDFVDHYQGAFYDCLLAALRSSMRIITDRFAVDDAYSTCWIVMPLFSVSISFMNDHIVMSPNLDEIEQFTREVTMTMMATFHDVYIWGQDRRRAKELGKTDHLVSYYTEISGDFAIGVMLLLLRGTFEGLSERVRSYISIFLQYDKLWQWNRDVVLQSLFDDNPSTAETEERLEFFENMISSIASLPAVRNMAAVSLKAQGLKSALLKEAETWRMGFAGIFRARIRAELDAFKGEIDRLSTLLTNASYDDFNDLASIVEILQKVRTLEANFDSRFFPIEEMYGVLERHGIAILEEAPAPSADDGAGEGASLAGGGGNNNNNNNNSSNIGGGGAGAGSSSASAAALLAHHHDGDGDLPSGLPSKPASSSRAASAVDPVGDLLNSWKQLRAKANLALTTILSMQASFRERLNGLITGLTDEVSRFAAEYDTQGPMQKGLKPSVASDRLQRFSQFYEMHRRKAETYNVAEAMFGLQGTDFPVLSRVGKEIKLLTPLYTLYTDVLTRRRDVEDTLWSEVDFAAIDGQFKDFDQKCRNLPKGLRDWDAYADLKQVIDDLNTVLPLLQDLADPSMRPRHWELLTEICAEAGHRFVMEPDTVRLRDLLAAPLLKKREAIEDMSYAAKKEAEIEAKLKAISSAWSDADLTFTQFKTRGFLLLKPDDTADVLVRLEESELILAGLMGSRYVKPFRRETENWIGRLSTCTDIIERWVTVQGLWVYLEAVFSGGDISRQLPLENKRFQGIDKQWVKIMNEAYGSPNIISCCCGRDTLKSMLPMLIDQMEISQKSLQGYLEIKRNLFPRFFFVSDAVLLEILGHSSDPQAIQVHLKSVFDNINYLHFSKAENVKNTIEVMESSEGERVSLVDPMPCEGNVEVWLLGLENEMRRAVKAVVKDMIIDLFVQPSAAELFKLLIALPAQVALLGLQISWTHEVDGALRRAAHEVNIMKTTGKKIALQLKELTRLTMDEWTREQRVKIESLVTILVHQRDVFDLTLYRKNVKSATDFDWLKQTRFYWREEKGDVDISICDINAEYCYEYLGCTDRLVITPLTDRCYITLSQALGMNMGGAPAGPAGTGKTETVKDMGKALGKMVIVFNCSDQMDFRGLGKIFKGLAMSGAWGCFDEFNRIELPVLSVVAQQVMCILTAMKAKQRDEFVWTDGLTYQLNKQCGFFITMNPGYAGRQELPENLKMLFRGVSMMVPDSEIIMRVKLSASGYLEAPKLASKLSVLYSLCKQQLSKQNHYDFGLRNILSVLRTCGKAKRDDKNKGLKEPDILMRVVRDMNVSKLVDEDEALFISLLRDTFPQQSVEQSDYPELLAGIADHCQKNNLVNHDEWRLKVIQLYETSLVRHGIMVLGPSGAGKSSCIKALLRALTYTGLPHKEVRMNPKAITSAQMFGRMDVVNNEYTDGIFSTIWRKNCKKSKEHIWFTLDGPVDTIWIENLNSVLDDNKTLTLANGDRIVMSPTLKLVFEVQNLDNASPATVSRAGMIYMHSGSLGWLPYAQSWCASRPTPLQRTVLLDLFTAVAPDLFRLLAERCSPAMALTPISIVTSACTLLSALLPDRDSPNPDGNFASKEALARLFVFAALWSFGGQLELAGRVLMDSYLRGHPVEGASGGGSAAADSSSAVSGSRGKESKALAAANLASLIPPPPAWVSALMPACQSPDSVFEFRVDPETTAWSHWKNSVVPFTYPLTTTPQFSSLLIPTVDSVRTTFLVDCVVSQRGNVLLIGESGTAKTVTVSQYLAGMVGDVFSTKSLSFSSATTHNMLQRVVEGFVEKRQGHTYGPAGGKRMLLFIDDISLPEINKWGDQETNELLRQLIEDRGIYSIDKPGDFVGVVDVQYLAAMRHSGAGNNDVPDRLKRHFAVFNSTLPSVDSVNVIFSTILLGHYNPKRGFAPAVVDAARKLTSLTRLVWERTKAKMLPTPSKFHYVFNLRDMSRIIQGCIRCTPEVITGPERLVTLWKHECERVLSDRFVAQADLQWYSGCVSELLADSFDQGFLRRLPAKTPPFVDFMRDLEVPEENYDPDAKIEMPRVYEPVEDVERLRARVRHFIAEAREVMRKGPRFDGLVLFEDALVHLARISRIIRTPRGSALLVGVGGSGKQSLTRLASYIAGNETFQIKLNKLYGTKDFLEDIKKVYTTVGVLGKPVTFLITDAEIKEESFLEYINNILASGEVANLFAKDELEPIISEMRTLARKDPRIKVDVDTLTPDALYAYFIEKVRDDLHIVLCFSPVGDKFRQRARKFPALTSGCTFDWFWEWPHEALLAVAEKYLEDAEIRGDAGIKEQVVQHMAFVHASVSETTREYFEKFRRQVSVTPKSFLSFLNLFKRQYADKLGEITAYVGTLTQGLEKLATAERDVKLMQVELKDKEVELAEHQRTAEVLLGTITEQTAVAEVKKAEVVRQQEACEEVARGIEEKKRAAEADLAVAKPALDAAMAALDLIKPADIQTIKKLAKPPNLVKRIMDGVLIMRRLPLGPAQIDDEQTQKSGVPTHLNSYATSVKAMSDANFLKYLLTYNRDSMTDEDCELLMPYFAMPDFNFDDAQRSSGNIAGLCVWLEKMSEYHRIAKDVGPKIQAVLDAEALLARAQREVSQAQAQVAEMQRELDEIRGRYEKAMREKQKLQAVADLTRRRLEAAHSLISGLSGERARWVQETQDLGAVIQRLAGDVSLATAFISYAGPFNHQYRQRLWDAAWVGNLFQERIPFTRGLDVVPFMVPDESRIGQWNLEGLPSDKLSVQNGVMVNFSARYPLLIDPQMQGKAWIKRRAARLGLRVTTLDAPNFRATLERCVDEGYPLLIEDIEEDLDPVLDSVLDKLTFRQGTTLKIVVGDVDVDFHPNFQLFMTTKLANPVFSPETYAKTAVIDFTVTLKGLEDQLLSLIYRMEQPKLEAAREAMVKEIVDNKKKLQDLQDDLLARLSNSKGNLVDDSELLDTLNVTKTTTVEVKAKLAKSAADAEETRLLRDEFREAAARGSIIYFVIAEMALVDHMYQTSLEQFLALFHTAVLQAKKDVVPRKRVANLVAHATEYLFVYISQGLFESHKQLFVLQLCLKIQLEAGAITPQEYEVFLKGSAVLPIEQLNRAKPSSVAGWMSDRSWLNINALATLPRFASMVHDLELPQTCADWRRWYDLECPEVAPFPGKTEDQMTPFRRLYIVRCWREDRTMVAAQAYIASIIGERFNEPVPLDLQHIYEVSRPGVPIVCLLSPGSDPSAAIESLARRNHIAGLLQVSMGQGQEELARSHLTAALQSGAWVLLQNCHLALKFMHELVPYLLKHAAPEADALAAAEGSSTGPSSTSSSGSKPPHPNFRVWITSEPNKGFSISLLQMAIKLTNEPPQGLRAGLARAFSWVNEETVDVTDRPEWHPLLYTMAFLHTSLLERRKYAALGFCIAYEFNQSDFAASLAFLSNYLYSAPPNTKDLSWSTIHYMVAEVHYGGRVTDDYDRRLLNTMCQGLLSTKTLTPGFEYRKGYPLPTFRNLAELRASVDRVPLVDSPELFGLHGNAEVSYRTRQTDAVLSTLLRTQPKGGGGERGDKNGASTSEEVIAGTCRDLLAKMPADYVRAEIKRCIARLGGLGDAFNVFLQQEVLRVQALLTLVRSDLLNIQLAIAGSVALSERLVDIMAALFDGRVPAEWETISWSSPNLGLWFSDLLTRCEQYSQWLYVARPVSFWITGFFNPSGFVTAMKQEITRAHEGSVSIDALDLRCEVLKTEHTLGLPPLAKDDGVYIHGLFLEGAGWDVQGSKLRLSTPKVLYTQLPVMHLAATSSLGASRDRYEAPLYRTPGRTDKNFIFSVGLRTDDPPSVWVTQSVCLLCSRY